MILLKTQTNMKIFFTTMALMMSAFALLAQSNAIIYTDFQPDSLMIVSAYNNQMLIDLNGDHNPESRTNVPVHTEPLNRTMTKEKRP